MNVRKVFILSLACVLVVAPIGLAQANDAHHPGGGAATKQAAAAKKKIKAPKKNVGAQKQSAALAPTEPSGGRYG